jgi:hypothetical protein
VYEGRDDGLEDTIREIRSLAKEVRLKGIARDVDDTLLPVTVLSRYAKGHVLPNTIRAKQLWRVLTKLVGLEAELRNRIKFDDIGYFDNTEIVGDYNILQQAANHALANFAGKRVTKILTAAVDGVPLATMVANALGVNLIVAKRNKEVGVKAFLDEFFQSKRFMVNRHRLDGTDVESSLGNDPKRPIT